MSAAAASSSFEPTAPPPYASNDGMDVHLLGKAEPVAARSPEHEQPPPYAAPLPPVAVSQPQSQVIYLQQPLGQEPSTAMCPVCQQFVTTQVSLKNGAMTWLLCAGLCLVGLNLGCCLIPFCVDSCKDAVHECPRCQTVLHVHKRI